MPAQKVSKHIRPELGPRQDGGSTSVRNTPRANPAPESGATLGHFDGKGNARMVDVSGKEPTARCAVARCEILMKPETFRLLQHGRIAKGDAFAAAKMAAIFAAKRTAEWIPLCHPLPIEHVEVRFSENRRADGFVIETVVRTTAKTGVEMEALTAASAAALTIYDMVKGYGPGLVVTGLRLIQKTGGKSDDYDENQSGNHHRV